MQIQRSNEREQMKQILSEVNHVIRGKEETVRLVMTAILAKGHILIEDIPGVGKTTLAIAFSRAMELVERRVQFTPDVLPSDVVGFNMIDSNGEFQYKPGAIVCNLLLADEINRTSTKTQSALLEVMEEGQVTVDGVTRKLPKPFVVIATQNPVGSAGTQMLPESQLDRFMVRISMGYPTMEEEVRLVKERQKKNPVKLVREIVSKEDVIAMQKAVKKVHMSNAILGYIAEIVEKTRNHEMVTLGASPRGTLALADMARAMAYVSERDYVLPEDVKKVSGAVLAHRLVLNGKAKMSHISDCEIIDEIIAGVPVPRI